MVIGFLCVCIMTKIKNVNHDVGLCSGDPEGSIIMLVVTTGEHAQRAVRRLAFEINKYVMVRSYQES